MLHELPEPAYREGARGAARVRPILRVLALWLGLGAIGVGLAFAFGWWLVWRITLGAL